MKPRRAGARFRACCAFRPSRRPASRWDARNNPWGSRATPDAARHPLGPFTVNGRQTSHSRNSKAGLPSQMLEIASAGHEVVVTQNRWPSAIRRSHRCEPMNPAAPDMMNRKCLLPLYLSYRRTPNLYLADRRRPCATLAVGAPTVLAGIRLVPGAAGSVALYGFWLRFGKVWRTVLPRRKIPSSASSRWAAASPISSGKCCCKAR
jgi:hypothetical protein